MLSREIAETAAGQNGGGKVSAPRSGGGAGESCKARQGDTEMLLRGQKGL